MKDPAETIFLGCRFAAKYPEGAGNFSVPLQWALGLQRLKLNFIWLEVLDTSGDPKTDRNRIRNFHDRMCQYGLESNYVLLLQSVASEELSLDQMAIYGALTMTELKARLAGPNRLLNLSYSIRPPFLMTFEHRVLCDLDPTEFAYWMQRIELGQSYHHQFWTIGLNMWGKDCEMARNGLDWKTFFPLVDTELNAVAPRPKYNRFTTVGQWYWKFLLEVDGDYPDLSKGAKMQKFLTLPKMVPELELELAMNFAAGDGVSEMLASYGWKVADPHKVGRTPLAYRRYLRSALGEFTVIKGTDSLCRSGWISDRACAFMATGRPVITENAGVSMYLPKESGFFEIQDVESAAEALRYVAKDWKRLSQKARATADECFEATKTLRRILAE